MTITQTGRRIALVGALALIVSLLPFAGASAIDGDNALQLSAADNVATSIANSQVLYTPITASHDGEGDDALADGPSEALIGRADLFADNLASGALQSGRPLFLNDQTDGVNADVLAELDRILPEGSTVHILGGELAQGEGVETALTDAGYVVNRFAGETRTETAIDIATTVGADTALLVRSTGEGSAQFADAGGAGALAAVNGWSILFTQTSQLTPSTADFLASDAAPASVIVVGGEQAISADAYDQVVEILGEENVSRVAGDAREDTAVALNGLRGGELGGFAILADGYGDDAWADLFTSANVSASGNYPIVLSNNTTDPASLPQASADYLESIVDDGAFANHFTNVALLCLSSTNTPDFALCNEALQAAGGTGSTSAFPPVEDPVTGPTPNTTGLTERAELETATVGDLVTTSQATASNPAGLRVIYDFDEDIASVPNPAAFIVHTASGAETAGTAASISTTDRSMVTVRFGTIVTQTAVDAQILATSALGAGLDFQGVQSIHGDFPIGAAGSSGAGDAGVTNRPDLLSVGNFRPADTNTQTAVDFVFDENTFVLNNANGQFYLIPTDQNAGTTPGNANCDSPATANNTASGGTVVGGNGTTTITALCNNVTAGTYLNPANYAVGVVQSGAVSDAAVGGNVTTFDQVGPINGTVTTTAPDLVSGSLALDVSSGGTNYDAAVFNFDNTITTTPTGTSFFAYTADPDTLIQGLNTPAPQRSGGQVLVYFTDGALANAVGIGVPAGTVTDGTRTNPVGEQGVTNAATADQTPGQTADPELSDASVQLITPTIGSASNQGVYTFDEDVAATPTPTSFFLFKPDGDQLTGATCTTGTTEDTDAIVTCSSYTDSGGTASSTDVGATVVGSQSAGGATAQSGGANSNDGSDPI